MTEEKETWFDRLSPEEQERRSKERSKRAKKSWELDPDRRQRQSEKVKKAFEENLDEHRRKILEGQERSRRRMRVLLGLEEEENSESELVF